MSFRRLAERLPEGVHKDIFKIISGRQTGMTEDSKKPLYLTPGDIEEIQTLTYESIYVGRSLEGVKDLSTVKAESAKMVTDSFFNPVTGIGTQFDPGYYNTADTPVSMTPMEITSYYASGGIPQVIIDTKAGGMLTNGYRFIGNGWNPADLERLKEYADSLNFDQIIRDGNRDGLLFGGALVVPAFKNDDPSSYRYSVKELVRRGILTKNSISYFWHADRWNCVLIPDYNISASDYLDPKTIFAPITGLTVNTGRAALLRPKQLPYWGTLKQMGWGVSEMEAWIRPLLGWEMSLAALPIMIQQMSVMYAHMPLDQMASTVGANTVQALAQKVQKELVQMSNVAPKTFSSGWELKALERNFTGFPELVAIQERAISAKAELSDTIIFNRMAKGMNASTEGESTIKAAGSIQRIANKIVPQMQNLVEILVYSCFGPDSEQAKIADSVRIDFDSPVVLTNQERNEAGTTFANVFSAVYAGGLQPADAMEVAKSFIPDIELPQDVLDRLKAVPELGEVGEGVTNLAERLQGGSDAVSSLADKLQGADGVGALASRLTGRKPGGLFSKLFGGTTDSLTWSGHKLQGRTKIQGMDISIENKKGSVYR